MRCPSCQKQINKGINDNINNVDNESCYICHKTFCSECPYNWRYIQRKTVNLCKKCDLKWRIRINKKVVKKKNYEIHSLIIETRANDLKISILKNHEFVEYKDNIYFGQDINQFKSFLSTFYLSDFKYKGVRFDSIEKCYQYQKCNRQVLYDPVYKLYGYDDEDIEKLKETKEFLDILLKCDTPMKACLLGTLKTHRFGSKWVIDKNDKNNELKLNDCIEKFKSNVIRVENWHNKNEDMMKSIFFEAFSQDEERKNKLLETNINKYFRYLQSSGDFWSYGKLNTKNPFPVEQKGCGYNVLGIILYRLRAKFILLEKEKN